MLNAIFPGIMPETFSISSGKITYLIPEPVGLYFNTLNIEYVKKNSSPFIIHYNETNSKQVKKQLGIKTKLWPGADSAVKCIILKHVMGHATLVLLVKKSSFFNVMKCHYCNCSILKVIA